MRSLVYSLCFFCLVRFFALRQVRHPCRPLSNRNPFYFIGDILFPGMSPPALQDKHLDKFLQWRLALE